MTAINITTIERALLTVLISRTLSSNPQSSKYDLQSIIDEEYNKRFSTSEINSVLYSNPGLFKRNSSKLPKWDVNSTINESGEFALDENFIKCDLHKYKGAEPRAWQIEAFDNWVKQGRRGVIEAVTGTGKTTVGIIAAADAIARGHDVLILVPGSELLEQWWEKCKKDLRFEIQIGIFNAKRKDSFTNCHLIISTIHSARKYELIPDWGHGLIIADEVHGYGSEKSGSALRDEIQERLGLTATYDRNDNGLEEVLCPYFSPKGAESNPGDELIIGCDYARGRSDQILAEFRVALLGLDFEDEEQEEYEYLSRSLSNLRKKLVYEHDCTDKPFGEFIKAVQILSKGGHIDYVGTRRARSFLNKFTQRRKLLAGSEEKLEGLTLLVPVLKKAQKSIIFSETVESAENASVILNQHGLKSDVFHSKLNRTSRKDRLQKFRSGVINILVAPKILDEGIDVPEADVGVILAASHTKRQMIQRMGRIIRPKKDNRVATFFILYMRNTNEDPAFGIHESFLEEMYDHALEVKEFEGEPGSWSVLKWFKGNKDA